MDAILYPRRQDNPEQGYAQYLRSQKEAKSGTVLRTTIFDGLGRPKEVRKFESQGSYVSTTQAYDQLGRTISTTNPSFSSDGVGATTTYTYDTLGRKTETKTPDGATASTSYSGGSRLPVVHQRITQTALD